MKYLLTLVGMVLFVGGCAGSQPYINPLPAETRDSIYIESVQIEMGGLKPNVSEGEIEKRQRIASILKETLIRDFENSPAGSDAATMVVNLTEVESSTLNGEVQIIRQKDNEELISYSVYTFVKRSGFMQMVQGGDSKFRDLSEAFSAQLQRQFLN